MKTERQKSSQEIQDEVFRQMSADEKVAVGAALWRLGKELAADKIDYGTNRPKTSSHKDS